MSNPVHELYTADTLPPKKWLVKVMLGFLCMVILPLGMLLLLAPGYWLLIELAPDWLTRGYLIGMMAFSLSAILLSYVLGGFMLHQRPKHWPKEKIYSRMYEGTGAKSLFPVMCVQSGFGIAWLAWVIVVIVNGETRSFGLMGLTVVTFMLVPIYGSVALLYRLHDLNLILGLEKALSRAKSSLIVVLIWQGLFLLIICVLMVETSAALLMVAMSVIGVFMLVAVIQFTRLCFELLNLWRQHDDLSGQFEAQRAANQLH